MKRHVLAAMLMAAGYQLADSHQLTADESGKTYANPVLTVDNPADPHVIRVGDRYYLYATTHGDGFDAFTSKDLVNWKLAGRAFDDPRGGAWAPDVFHNQRGDGKFYLYYTDDDPAPNNDMPHAKQIGVAVADDPLGPFVDKHALASASIDAHLFQDDDGKFYLYYVHFTPEFTIVVQHMADPLTKSGKPTEVIRPTQPWEMESGDVTEGPWMLKHKGTYYLMYSGTGADSPDYAIGYATAKSPLGPFTKYHGNPIVGRTEDVLGPGHHCVVSDGDDKLWMVYHQKYTTRKSFHRFLAIDPLWFDDAGVIHARVTKGKPQPAPRAID